MMEIEVGDDFKQGSLLFVVNEKLDLHLIRCNLFYNKRVVATSYEHPNTLLKMQKLSSLEKELM